MTKKPKWRFNIYKSKHFSWKPGFYCIKKLLWKDKYNTPRTEREPHYSFWFGYWTFELRQGNEEEWEQWLWINYYNKGDIKKAKETWEWTNTEGKSTWIDYSYYSKN